VSYSGVTVATSSSPREELLLFDSEPNAFVFGAWKNVLIAVWAGQLGNASVERFTKAVDAMGARRPGLRSNVHVITEGTALPTQEARAALVASMTRHSSELACVAVVFCGSGFWASALRAAVTGMRFLAPRSFDFELFSSVDEASQWLPANHKLMTGVSLDPIELRDVLRAAQANLRAPGSYR
jgi:hypothetical protein